MLLFWIIALVVIAALVVAGFIFIPAALAAVTPQNFAASASVGDFVTVTIDHLLKTIAYVNVTNGVTGTVTYTINKDGTYDVTDSTGNITNALEIPGYQIMLLMNKAGPSANEQALVVGVLSDSTTITASSSGEYNYMKFRTSNGGFLSGALVMTNGVMINTGFSSLSRAVQPAESRDVAQTGSANVSAHGTVVVTLPAVVSSNHIVPRATAAITTVFASGNGFLTIDDDAGSTICMKQAGGAAFSASSAATYTALFYSKPDVMLSGGTETGAILVGKCSIVVTAAALVTVTNIVTNAVMFSGTVTPFSSDTSIVGSSTGMINNPCNGLFRFTNSTQEFVITFFGKSILFGSVNSVSSTEYSYFYGAGLSL